MAITRFSSACSSSPTPSENSDMYYEDFDHATPSPAPSQTADAYSWETDNAPVSTDPLNITPTAQAARASTPESMVEISPEDIAMPQAPAPATVTKPRTAKAAKQKKGKDKAKPTEAAAAEPVAHTRDKDDPFLTTDLARATAASLSQQTEHDNATAGASVAPPGCSPWLPAQTPVCKHRR
ncbi:hypothetical protein B0H10DRAFT_2218670 [Mycena sp. CBHHK59/15]|nr:hypothetical protein B0H10DRAFT_2218670 [Mycena sp. CBHHK59/15]